MYVSVLGPVKVEDGSGEVVLGAAKERSLLAVLALNAGSVVGAERLIDALWGDAPPASARKTLQTYVSNIRRALGSDVVATEPTGYVLRVSADAVDVGRFRALVRGGEDALREGSTGRARETLAEAIRLWRGEPFGGLGLHTGLAAEAVRLREEYASALEARLAADLAAGHHRELVGELEVLVRAHPFRERLWGHLMVALYRSGRQADALAAYERARMLLREELGLEPGGELQRIERGVLAHDPSLGDAPKGRAVSSTQMPIFRSTIRYAVGRDGVHLAYQIVGDGPIDVLAVPGFVSHLDMWWDAPTDRLVRRLASFSRLILFDKRGMGLSDRPPHIDPEQWVDDVESVLDEAGSEKAVIFGISAGAPTAALYAAGHPERTRALILYGGYAKFLSGEGYELGANRATVDSFIANMEARWGTGVGISVLAPSRSADPAARQFWARLQTTSASPSAATTFLRALTEIDVRHALPAIAAPTLILHAERDHNTPVESARLCKELIPGARLVELDSDIHLIWLSDVVDNIITEIESFIAQTIPDPTADHVLATLLAIAPPSAASHLAPAIDAVVQRCGGGMLGGPGLAMFDGPARAVRCGLALISEICTHRQQFGVAVHSGECQVVHDGVHGVAVDLTRQLAARTEPGEVLVSQTIRDLVIGSATELTPRGRLSFDDVPGEWEVFAVVDARR
jgi:DNA-binding SARP family transcriptional activator/pimeloyl-ACP methyl ester carboxylesterase